ncbi:MAG: ABC transporter ATP-binding protein [Clostridiales bacterium]
MTNTDCINSEPVVRIEDLHVHFPLYQGTARVLNGVNLEIQKGCITGIVGESGCGKTMASSAILQLIPKPGHVVKGHIYVNGHDVVTMNRKEINEHIRGKISFVPQGARAAMNPVFTVGEQISRIYRVNQGMSKKEAMDAAEEALKRVGIPEARKRLSAYPHELSGGMCQRVLIVMGIAAGSTLLIADEPTTGLDVTVQAQILDMIQEMIAGNHSSCMFITHDLGVIAEISQYVAVMYGGQVVEYGTTEDIFLTPMHPYTKRLIGATLRVDVKKEITSIPGLVPSALKEIKGCYFAERCDIADAVCFEQEPPEYHFGKRCVKCHKAGGACHES